MTPKEKAEILLNKMYECADPLYKYPMCFDTARQTALIAVNEILESFVINLSNDQLEFWEQVKKEILDKKKI